MPLQPDSLTSSAFESTAGVPSGPVDQAALDELDRLIKRIAANAGKKPDDYETRMVRELMVSGLKLIPDGRDTGELKLMSAAMKELRHAYRVFGRYKQPHKVTIFGSARTPDTHPDYLATVEFSRLMAAAGWMIITGAGGGIMAAGHVGPGKDASFGVAIRLPFETTANHVIAGDEKLIHFRYFFTRKLMFISQAEAVVLCPGGFGTLDEAYETLTLVQTGKAPMMPIVLLEGAGGGYWASWEAQVRSQLLDRGLISPEDLHLWYHAKDPADAVRHITHFYRNYHSARYVKDDLVIRLNKRLKDADVARIGREFGVLIKSGELVQRGAYDVELDHLDLPRIAFTHTKHKFSLIRKLIDAINDCEPA